MYYTIYKVTNKLNGKFYIGKHQTKKVDDAYYGSGKAIKEAIQKYGVENFYKEVLFIFDTEDDMNNKEKELITILANKLKNIFRFTSNISKVSGLRRLHTIAAV